MADAKVRPFRYTKGKLSVEVTYAIIFFTVFFRLFGWGYRRLKPIAYHPLAWPGIALSLWLLWVNPYLALVLFVATVAAVALWSQAHPDSYHRYAEPRLRGFLAGFKYRYRPRRMFSACALLDDKDPIPTVTAVRQIGCTREVRIRMNHGDDLDLWRARASRLAQTFGALDCRVNPHRRAKFTSFHVDEYLLRPPFIRYHFAEKVTKPRFVQLEFLAKDPFSRTIGPEYIHYWRTGELLAEEGYPVGPLRTGRPYLLKTRTHLLVVAMSQWGKSTAERTMIYLDHWDVQAGLVENWGCDLKRGVEIDFMKDQFTRVEYGLEGPRAVARFWADAKKLMNERLDAIREQGEDVRHIASPGDPKLKIYVDEWLAFEDPEYAEVRNDIYRDANAIQRRGAAANIEIRAFAQDPKKDRFPNRDGFPEVWVGGVLNRTQVDMVMPGGWEAGARAEELPQDLPGVFYARGEASMAPVDFRIVRIPNDTIKRLKRRPDSAIWPPPEPQTKEELREQVRQEVMMA